MRPSHTGLLLRFCWTEMGACRFFAIAQLEPRIDAVAAPDAAVVPRRVFDIMHAEMLAGLTDQLFHDNHLTIFYYQIIVKSTLSFDSK